MRIVVVVRRRERRGEAWEWKIEVMAEVERRNWIRKVKVTSKI